MDRFAAGLTLPGRTVVKGMSRKALRGTPWLLSALILLHGTSWAGALPDVAWTRTFDPIQGGFNRGEPARVRVSLNVGDGPAAIMIAWRLQQGGTQIAVGDTLVAAARRGGETSLTLRLPPLSAGQYVLDLAADPANTIEEKDEMNNRAAFNLVVPNGSPVLFRCEGPEGSTWKIQRVELNTISGDPYPDAYGTRADTTRTTEDEIVVAGVEPGAYAGIVFGPSVNKMPIAVSYGSFEMQDPTREIPVIWQRMTPYLVGRPKVNGDKDSETLGGRMARRCGTGTPASSSKGPSAIRRTDRSTSSTCCASSNQAGSAPRRRTRSSRSERSRPSGCRSAAGFPRRPGHTCFRRRSGSRGRRGSRISAKR